jgi:hypothetical protein
MLVLNSPCCPFILEKRSNICHVARDFEGIWSGRYLLSAQHRKEASQLWWLEKLRS